MPSYAYELIIALVAAGVPLLVFWLRSRPKHLRGEGFLSFIAPFLVLGWGVVLYGSFIEPHFLVTREYAVRLPEHTSALGHSSWSARIAVISDMHLGMYKHEAWLKHVVQQVNAAKPDLVLIAGDVVSSAAGIEELAPLAELQSTYGQFAVLGNHDYEVGGVDVRKSIERYRVEVLTNESVPVSMNGNTVRLVGLDDLWYGILDWDKALADRKEGESTVLLVHNPDFAIGAEIHDVDLVIAGHTHGGQIRLPFIGSVPALPTKLGRRYDMGLFPIGTSQLFITPGVGESGPRARLFDPPEVSILTLTF
jgi:hypothetical protein